MIIRIEYLDGTVIELKHVQTITLTSTGRYLLDGSTFDIKCFGNGPVTHKWVANLDIVTWT